MKNFIAAIIPWFTAGARWRLSFSHCFEGLIVQTFVAVATWLAGLTIAHAWLVGAGAVIVFYYAHEMTQFQARIKPPGASNVTVWTRGWWPMEWGANSLLDWVFPAVSSSAIAALVWWVAR